MLNVPRPSRRHVFIRVRRTRRSCTRCISMKCGYFYFKKHVKFGRMIENCFIQGMLQRLLHIFPIFRAICEYHAGKIFPFSCESFIESFFHIFIRTKALLSKCVKLSMQTSGNLKEASLVSKLNGVELPSWVHFRRIENRFCCRAWWSSVMTLCCLFRYFGLSSSKEQFNRSIVVGKV